MIGVYGRLAINCVHLLSGKIMVNDSENYGIQFHTQATNVCEL